MNTKKQVVYFMRPVGMLGPIKIGCTTCIDQRLENLSVWSPVKLEVIYSEAGSYKLEQDIHRVFADYHSHREWFHPGERLLQALGKLKNGMTIETAIDLSDVRGEIRKTFKGKRKPVPEFQKEMRSYKARIYWAVRKLSEATKLSMYAPDSVTKVMEAWEGSWRNSRKDARRPTAEEFKTLDAFLAAPKDHCIPYSVKFPKRAAA